MGNIENLIMNILMFLFSKHRSNIFTSFNESEYYQAVNKLKEQGVSCRSRITGQYTGTMSSNSQYDIYVKKVRNTSQKRHYRNIDTERQETLETDQKLITSVHV